MKRSLKVLSLTCLIVGLSACSGGGSSALSSSLTPSSDASSSLPSGSSSVSSSDRYQGRIKPVEFSIVDLLNVPWHGSDPHLFDDPKPIEDYIRQEKLKLYYLDQVDDVYYLSLDDYASIFKDEVTEGYVSTVKSEGDVTTWSVNKGNETVFSLSMDPAAETLTLKGELDSTFLKSAPYGKTGEQDLLQLEDGYLPGHENVARVYPFGPYEFDFFKVDGKYRYPLALLQTGLSQVTERSLLFNAHEKQLFEYGPSEQLKQVNFALPSGGSISAFDYLLEGHEKEFGDGTPNSAVAPHSLNVFNKKVFYFIMDSFYGMADQKGIRSMSDYFDSFEMSADYDSDNTADRFYAYARSIDMLNDLHSSYYPSDYFAENIGTKEYHYEQTFTKDRYSLRAYLQSERLTALRAYNKAHGTKLKMENMRYSSDGRYGFFSFDTFDTYNYFEEGEVPEDVLIGDTFYMFLHNLNEAKAQGVKRVVIDDTTNLGGFVGIMSKILALLSKDNKSETFLRCDGNDGIYRSLMRVDANKDGKFDASDCFGNDFEFYITTSNFSFSCGNAFPFYARRDRSAKIVGERSGGGECCVFEYAFPSGQLLRYSSPYHVGYWDEAENNYVGDEFGGKVDIILNGFHDLYDVDAIAAFLDAEDPMKA